jgi:hypothetical protein
VPRSTSLIGLPYENELSELIQKTSQVFKWNFLDGLHAGSLDENVILGLGKKDAIIIIGCIMAPS